MDAAPARRLALNLLARREHSRRELHEKLMRRGCAENMVAPLVARLEAEGLVSDQRFAESLVRVRRERGCGPVRIGRELREKGVAPDIIDRCVDETDREWGELIREVWRKKYGDGPPRTLAERAKQARFLQYRGFTHDQIRRVLSADDED